MKVPEPRKLKSGSWFIQLRLDGTSVPITSPSKTECRQQAQLIKAEYLAGKRKVDSSSITLGSLIDVYIEKSTPALSPSTVMGYDTIRRCRFQSYMDRPLRDIKDWQIMINEELATVSVHTVKNAWFLVTAALKDSGRDVPTVKLPRSPVREMPYLQPEEIPLFLSAIEGDPAELEMLLCLHGLRRSEALAVIRNRRIDLEKHQIIVSGAVVPDKSHQLVEKDVNKSAASTRIVPIMVPRLTVLVKELNDSGKDWPVHSSPIILKHIHTCCQAAGITDVTNHGLRHTFACLGYSLGISERALMELGGWDDPTTMHKIYIRVAQRDKERAKNKIAEFYQGRDPEKMLEDGLQALRQFRAEYKDLPAFADVIQAVDKLLGKENANGNANDSEKTA